MIKLLLTDYLVNAEKYSYLSTSNCMFLKAVWDNPTRNSKLLENNMYFLFNYTLHEPTSIVISMGYKRLRTFSHSVQRTKYLIKLKWLIHCFSNSLFFGP